MITPFSLLWTPTGLGFVKDKQVQLYGDVDGTASYLASIPDIVNVKVENSIAVHASALAPVHVVNAIVEPLYVLGV